MFETIKETALKYIEDNKNLLIEVSDKIWSLPEVGLQEIKTAKTLINILRNNDFKVISGVAYMPSAFVATYGSGRPVIGIIGELDALPGLSQKKVPYKEPIKEGGPGHGCNHNGYAVTALGGALAVKVAMEEEEDIKGTIKYFGCPAEETLIGKVFMVRDGIFDGLDACLGHHPGRHNGINMSQSNAMNSVKFEFFGSTAHAAGSPEKGISALDAVELMNMGVNYLREHVIQEARMHYIIEEGGRQPNVVPDYARSWYYVRAPTREAVNMYYNKVLKIAEGANLMTGTTHKVRFLTGVHEKITPLPLAELVTNNMREIGTPTYNEEELEFARKIGETTSKAQKKTALRRSPLPNAMELIDIDLDTNIYDPYGVNIKGGSGSTDVAEVCWKTPTVEFATVSRVVECPSHSWQNVALGGISVGHKSTIFASKVMALSVIDLITKPKELKNIQDAWREMMEGCTYISPLPPDLKPPLDQLQPM